MVNLYKVKKWSANFLMAFLPTITFLIMILTADFFQAIISFFIMIPFAMFISGRLMSHPIIEFLEGKGLLVWTIDSTGLIEPFLVNVDSPFLRGNHKGKEIETVFDRDSISYMKPPRKIGGLVKEDDKEIELKLRIPKDKKNDITFGLSTFPVLIYNKNLEQFISKEALAKFEKDTFVTHMVLYLNKKAQDLTNQLRDFARYIVEQTRPKKPLLGGWLKWVLVLAAILIIGMLALPVIMNIGGGATASGGGSIFSPR